MFALFHAHYDHLLCGDDIAARLLADELVALADEKGALFWKAHGSCHARLRIWP